MRPLSVFVQASTQLRYCETCLVGGFHAAWFQWQPLERCPLHNQRFRSGYFECAAPIPYILGADLASSPLRCSNCRCNWVPALHRSAGRCSPFRRRDRERIRQWANYVNDVITVDHRLHRDWCNGKYVAAKPKTKDVGSTRPHVLTMVNRLFDRPPPMLASLTARFEAQRHSPLRVLTTGSDGCADDHIGYGPQQWPQFEGDFAHCERLVRAAQNRLFAQALPEFQNAPRRQILVDRLIVPTNALRQDVATALGWTVSWLGASHLLTSRTELAAPALGLVGWLARIPLRPANTAPAAWHDQVLTWLRDDLELSAWVWSRVAAIMSSRRFYLLYGEAVRPAPLTTRHQEGVR